MIFYTEQYTFYHKLYCMINKQFSSWRTQNFRFYYPCGNIWLPQNREYPNHTHLSAPTSWLRLEKKEIFFLV